jgi:hypothetical protein
MIIAQTCVFTAFYRQQAVFYEITPAAKLLLIPLIELFEQEAAV